METIFKNANLIDFENKRFNLCDIKVSNGKIKEIGKLNGKNEIDLKEKYIVPSFIDSHLHIESSFTTPKKFANIALAHGVTTLIADPHEMVNVLGIKVFDFLLKDIENYPINLFYMIPSCVPSTSFETSGAIVKACDMEPYIKHPHILGLGEVMSFTDLINGKEDLVEKINLAKKHNKMVDGHSPGLTGDGLKKYISYGVMTDHECEHYEEALEKEKLGMKILVREGSAAKNLESIISGIVKNNYKTDNFMFCTDDKKIKDIIELGYIDYNIKKSIELGLDIFDAYKMSSYNAAKTYNLFSKGIGNIDIGFKADFIVLDDLEKVIINSIYKDGKLVTFNEGKEDDIPSNFLDTVKYSDITLDDIKLKLNDNITDIIELNKGSLLTNHLKEEVLTKDSCFLPNQKYNKLVVKERHGINGNISVAPIKGYNIKNAAIASTVAHDSHNVVCIGDNDLDIVYAINKLKEIGGGYILVSNQEVIGEIPFKFAGLMSLDDTNELTKNIDIIEEKAKSYGVTEGLDPFINLSFLALPVIPSIRLTDMGLFDVNSFKIIRK